MIKHLLLSPSAFSITILTRSASKTSLKYPSNPSIQIVEADYTSPNTLAPSLHGQDAVVSLINRSEQDAQMLVIDATVLAGVPRFIPSCFGVGREHHEILRKYPAFFGKTEMEDRVLAEAEKGVFNFTGIHTSLLFDWAISMGVFLNCKDKGVTMVFDGGDVRLSLTLLDDAGKAAVAALEKPEETRNQFLKVQSKVVTQNQMLEWGKEVRPDKEWERREVDTEVLEKQSWEKWEKGDRSREVQRGFMPRTSFGLGLGLFKDVANELLGVRVMSDEEVKDLIRRSCSG